MQKSNKYKSVLFAMTIISVCIASVAYSAVTESDMISHKSLYDFKLVSAKTGSGISSIKGKIYFEQDDVCNAWTTNYRLTTEHRYSNEPIVINTSRYATFESKDQRQFNFDSEHKENGGSAEQLRGSVEISKDGTAKAVYSRPAGLSYNLPKNYLLPMAHTIEVIRHARAGNHFFNAVIFDGTDADGPVEIGTFIGKKATINEMKKIFSKGKKINASLLTSDAWHVRIAVFPLKDNTEITPSYEMALILHDNGVVSYAMVDYKTFSIEQTLTALEKLPQKKCN